LKLNQLSEIGLIDYLRRRFSQKIAEGELNKKIVVSIGDDAAVIQVTKNKYLILSSDTLVENVHFRRRWTNFEQLGWKAIAVVLSDFAAMGGVIPRYLLINLGLPVNFSFSEVKRFYSGIKKICQRWKIIIVGGDTVRAEKIFFSVFLVGETKKNNFLLRRGAKIGDLIFSTGPLGEAAAGLSLLEKGYLKKNIFLRSDYRRLIKKHLFPQPRMEEGKILAEKKLATSMIDCSDGLKKSVEILAQESNLSAEIYLENLPLTRALKNYLSGQVGRELANELFFIFWQLALFGGEDYELIFTAEEKNYEKILQYIPSAFSFGKIQRKKNASRVSFYHFGKPVHLKGEGYDAFLP